jgi:glutathione S-transferase
MIKLYGFGEGLGMPDPSPFVVKVDAYCRFAGLEYESVMSLDNLKQAPKKKLPYIDDGAQRIADSFFIIEHLKAKYGFHLDDPLTEQQKALIHPIGRALDEDLYWCLVYSRWVNEEGWAALKPGLFGSLPFPLKAILPPVLRRGVKKTLQQQGLGRHSEEEILTIARHHFESLSVLIGDKEYCFGAKPCSLDATIYGHVGEFILSDVDNGMSQLARSFPVIVRYCQQIQKAFYQPSAN